MVINSNNGSGGDSGVNIGGSIKRIEYNNIFISLLNDKLAGLSFASAGKVNRLVLLLRSKNSKLSGETKGTLQKVVGDNIKLLLVLSLYINLSLKSKSLTGWKLGSLDKVGDGLASSLNSSEKSGQFGNFRVEHGNLSHESLEGNSGGLAYLVEDRGVGLGFYLSGREEGRSAGSGASWREGSNRSGGEKKCNGREFHVPGFEQIDT
mmetsp:Transcript_3257/g.4804  ORF Transcript_3257/g.4804 Transcript_3257/m.4804 type:complete len:207 (+) Transcript_3257:726-1346(+)